MEVALVMKKLVVTACLALGLSACGGTEVPEESSAINAAQQELIDVQCPAGYTYYQTGWVCSAPTSTCPNGRNEEHVFCRNSSGSVVDAGRNGRTNGCCLGQVEL
jgi:uncharacterized lipoprotein